MRTGGVISGRSRAIRGWAEGRDGLDEVGVVGGGLVLAEGRGAVPVDLGEVVGGASREPIGQFWRIARCRSWIQS